MPLAVLCCAGKKSHILRDGGSSWGGWTGCRAESPESPMRPGQGEDSKQRPMGSTWSPQHPEFLTAPDSARCPPWAPEAAWPLPTLSSCQLVLQAWGRDEAKQNKSSRGTSGEAASVIGVASSMPST